MLRMVGTDRWSMMGVVVLFALSLAACDEASGGGWILSITGYADKAKFGFTVKCRDALQDGVPTAIAYAGQIEWHDGPVRFHGDVEPMDFMVFEGSCRDLHELSFGAVAFEGTYRPQPRGARGRFSATVVDSGAPGSVFVGDAIVITLEGGRYAGYINGGSVEGGSIQIR